MENGLILRDFCLEDVDVLAGLTEDPEVAHFDGNRIPGGWTAEEQEKLVWVPELVSDHLRCAIGVVVCRRLNDQPTVYSIGIDLNADNRGMGLGKLVMRQALHRLFAQHAADRVELMVRDYNARAIRCYQAVGFIHEGLRRSCGSQAGIIYGEMLMGILREEYFARNHQP